MKRILSLSLFLFTAACYGMEADSKQRHPSKDNQLSQLPEELSQKIGSLCLADTPALTQLTQELKKTVKPIKTLPGYFGQGTVCSHGSLLAVNSGGFRTSTLRLYSLDSEEPLAERYCPEEAGYVEINRQGTHLLRAPLSSPISIYSTEQPFQQVHTIDTRVPCFACFTPDGNQVVTFGGGQYALSVWDYTTGQRVQSIDSDTTCVWGEFSPNGQLLLTINTQGTAKLWDWQEGTCLHILSHDSIHELESAHFNSLGTMVATASKEGEIKVWNTTTGTCLTTFQQEGQAREVQFYGERYLLCTTRDPHEFQSRNCKLSLWDLEKERHCFTCLLSAQTPISLLRVNGNLELVYCTSTTSVSLVSLEQILQLLRFLTERITIEQAATILYSLSAEQDEQLTIQMSFKECPELQQAYDSLPYEIKALLDPSIEH